MRRLAGTLAAVVMLATCATAQAPPDVLRDAAKRPWLQSHAQLSPVTPPAKLLPNLSPVTPAQKFDTSSLRLKRERGQWQLWAGTLMLKDFGASEAEAHEALQVFRDLRVNARGSIG